MRDLVNAQHSDRESACHATPDAMQPLSTATAFVRSSADAAQPEMSSTNPSAVEAARHASAEFDQSMSKTEAECENEVQLAVAGEDGTGSTGHAMQQAECFSFNFEEIDCTCTHLPSNTSLVVHCNRCIAA